MGRLYEIVSSSAVERDFKTKIMIGLTVLAPFDGRITWGAFLILALFFVFLIFLLNIYYGKISKTNTKNLSEVPIYQSKDILLQEKSIDGIYLTQEKNISIWTKLTIYVLVIIAIITPLYQLFGIEYFI